MQTPADSNDRTVFQRAASTLGGGRTASFVDARQIGALSAINPLVAAANPLLMTIASLRQGGAPANVDALRSRLLDMVKDFDTSCERLAVPEDQRHLARYALCTVLDETIQRTPWAAGANWPRQSLLIHFFRENWGGEKFYQILDKLVATPAKFAWLLQLFYVCLSLGFMGRFLLQEAAGRQAVNELRERLYNLIRQGQPEVDRVLSQRWQGLSVAARQFKGFTAMWLLVGSLAVLCLAVYATYALLLASDRDGLGLERLALKPAPPSRMAQAPAAKPRLAQLLATEITAKKLLVSETQLESKVTLGSEATFDSGSATPARDAAALVDRVAWALEQVPGRVLVTGHTDSLPPSRSLAFQSNFELSQARARAVADLIRARLKDPSRVSHEGRGSSEPVDPNGRADAPENRRVEIKLRVDGTAE